MILFTALACTEIFCYIHVKNIEKHFPRIRKLLRKSPYVHVFQIADVRCPVESTWIEETPEIIALKQIYDGDSSRLDCLKLAYTGKPEDYVSDVDVLVTAIRHLH
jgi:hypothetical protein